MVDLKDSRVKEVLEGMHEAMQRMLKRGGKPKEDYIMENRIMGAICANYEHGPTRCADMVNDKYGYNLCADEVIQIFRNLKIANPAERKKIWQWAESVAALFVEALSGKKEAFEKLEKRRKETPAFNGKRHESQERIAAIMIYRKNPKLDIYHDIDNLYMLGNTFSKYYFYDIVDVISEVYGFPQSHENKKKVQTAKPEKQMSYEQALKRIGQLEDRLERTNTMLSDLQDEFAQQLEASKIKELADFFAKLNSEKYGCILDELLVVKKGVDELRKNNFELPIEINGLLIMVKKLIQFVRDSHIEPIMKINAIKDVVAADVEFCNYDGTPFAGPDEIKKVSVVSPGWIYKDKEIQISRPKVKEEE